MYRDCLRRFIKGGAECLPELISRIRGSDDLYGQRDPAASVNFVSCHDGFTLYDLVSCNGKHNRYNGEDNRDGTNDNTSWNCGAEGDTDDPAINALRLRQMKNLLTVLLTSRGIPMLLSGDELANTQCGNNNAYCQDNEISWLDWNRLEAQRDLYDYVHRLIAFRKAHPKLREENYEDHARYGTQRDAFICVAVNACWEELRYALPALPEDFRWKLAFEAYDVSTDPGDERPLKDQSAIALGPRAEAVFIASVAES